MPDPDPIQEQLATARRGQILEAATRVFSEKGYHRATIRDVAQAAGIADGTIYNYFANKAALLLGILDRLNQTAEREGHFAQASDIGIEEWTRQYIQQRFAAIGPEGRRLLQVVLAEALTDRALREQYAREVVQPTYALAEGFFRQWIAAGEVRPVDPALALRVVSAVFLGVIMLQLIGDPVLEAHKAELPDVIADLVLNGLKEKKNESPA